MTSTKVGIGTLLTCLYPPGPTLLVCVVVASTVRALLGTGWAMPAAPGSTRYCLMPTPWGHAPPTLGH